MSRKKTLWYVLHAPEIGNKFKEFYKMCNEGGVLDKKTKELLMLSTASILHCPDSIEKHLEGAFEAGATKAEITETILITAAIAGNTQLAWAKQIYNKYLGESSHK